MRSKVFSLGACIVASAFAGGCLAAPSVGDALARADADHDGYVSGAEFQAMRASEFARLDRNGDGVVSLADFPRLARSDRPQAQQLKAMIARADRNGDGRVTRAEFIDGPTTLFDLADTDHDGRLSHTEVEAAREQFEALK